jgi:hypothetical protein
MLLVGSWTFRYLLRVQMQTDPCCKASPIRGTPTLSLLLAPCKTEREFGQMQREELSCPERFRWLPGTVVETKSYGLVRSRFIALLSYRCVYYRSLRSRTRGVFSLVLKILRFLEPRHQPTEEGVFPRQADGSRLASCRELTRPLLFMGTNNASQPLPDMGRNEVPSTWH